MSWFGRLFVVLTFCFALINATSSKHKFPATFSSRLTARLHQQQTQQQHNTFNHDQDDPVGAASSEIVYVNQVASTGGDGTSWASAYQNLNTALQSAAEGSQLWIAQGTYTPTNEASDLTATFTLSTNNIALLGGFQGTETSVNQRDISSFKTILSGKIDDSNNVQHVVTVTSFNSIVDGITIQDGDSTGTNDGDRQCTDCFGGGIYFRNPLTRYAAEPPEERDAKLIDAWQHMQEVGNTDLKYYLNLTNVTLKNNIARSGGGMFLYADLVVTLQDCDVIDNVAQTSSYHVAGGAGIYASMAVTLIIKNSLFSNNNAPHRGAAIYGDYGVDFDITQSDFQSNVVSNGHGGAIYVTDRASNADTTTITLTANTFDGNKASGYGGAVFLYNGVQGLVTSNTFTQNSAGLSGGALTLYSVKTGDVCDLAQANFYADNTAQNASDCYDTDFPDVTAAMTYIEDFGPYLTQIESNFDASDEPSARPNVVYVDNTAVSSGTGLSWADAVRTIQEGIDLATSSGQGALQTEVWVRGGTGTNYAPTQVPDWVQTNNRYYNSIKSKTLDVEQNVWIFGGFAGYETVRSERNIYENPTRVSGKVQDAQGTELYVYQVVNLQEGARIDGFIVSDGYGYTGIAEDGPQSDSIQLLEDLEVSEKAGKTGKSAESGMKGEEERRRLKNLIARFEKVHAEKELEEFDEIQKRLAGGMYGDSSSSGTQLSSKIPNRGNGIFANATSTIANCVIANNFGSIGGGMYVLFHRVSAVNTGLVNNYSSGRGGAIQIDVSGVLECETCFFEDNVSEGKGGAIYLDYASSLYMHGDGSSGGCNFNDNTAYDGGGAVAADGSSNVYFECDEIVLNGNKAFQDGGALYEGSYSAYHASNRFSFQITEDIEYENDYVLDSMGVNDLFVWNYNSVSYSLK